MPSKCISDLCYASNYSLQDASNYSLQHIREAPGAPGGAGLTPDASLVRRGPDVRTDVLYTCIDLSTQKYWLFTVLTNHDDIYGRNQL